MKPDIQAYTGGETTGFQSPAQDSIVPVVDLAEMLEVRSPSRYAVRIKGEGFAERGIRNGDIAIVDTALKPFKGQIAIVFVFGDIFLSLIGERAGAIVLLRPEPLNPVPLGDDAEIWGIVVALVRERM